jgi:hypothetical protein
MLASGEDDGECEALVNKGVPKAFGCSTELKSTSLRSTSVRRVRLICSHSSRHRSAAACAASRSLSSHRTSASRPDRTDSQELGI